MTISREVLYERVWRTPLTKLAKELDVSYPSVVSLCQQLNVPRPMRGHWIRLKLGLPVHRPVLPDSSVAIVPDSAGVQRAIQKSSKPSARGPETPGMNSIEIPKTLVGCRPLTTKLGRSFEGGRVDRTGLITPLWGDVVLSVSVSKAQIQRALRLMDALIRAIESRGGRFIQKEKDCAWTGLTLAGEHVGFRLFEIVDKRQKSTVDEQKKRWLSPAEKWDYTATGRLKFEILGAQKTDGRRSWADCTAYRLEEKLSDIVKWLTVAADAAREARLAEEERKRYWDEVHRKSAEEERRRLIELRHREKLEEAAAAWAKAEALRAFIRSTEQVISPTGDTSHAPEWAAKWLAWAREHADRIDPFRGDFVESQRKRFDDQPHAGTPARPANPRADQSQ